ncbi:MAG: ATP-binding protein [Opitutae bacterium]|nr:ATP-binding protein [Opitutae bacterium]
MPSAYLLCGPSLAGKSSLGRQIVSSLGAVVSSADAINVRRGLPFGGEGLPESVWAETLEQQLADLRELGTAGKSAVVDDTLCYRWLRNRFRAAAQAAGLEAKLLLLRPTTAEILARREQIERDNSRPLVSLSRLNEHLATFEWPIPEEGAIDVTTLERQSAWLRAELGAR